MQIYDVNGNVYDGYSFSGKSIITFGDGITSEDGKTYAGETVKGYQGYLRDAGFTVTNAGISNACITYHAGDPTDICETVHDTSCTGYDYVMIAGGVNDFRLASSPMGELTDSDFDSGTFIGALQFIIEKIVNDNADAKIFFVTPLLCDGWNTPNSLGYTLTNYSDAIKYVAAKYAIPVLDFTSVAGINDKNIGVLTRDGVHPKNTGFQLLSSKLMSFVNSLNTGSENTERGIATFDELMETLNAEDNNIASTFEVMIALGIEEDEEE